MAKKTIPNEFKLTQISKNQSPHLYSTINKNGNPVDFVEPHIPSEADIVFATRQALENAGFIVRSEYSIEIDNKRTRLDIIIIHEGKIVGVIECKRSSVARRVKNGQYHLYKKLGVPMIYICGMSHVWYAPVWAKSLLSGDALC